MMMMSCLLNCLLLSHNCETVRNLTDIDRNFKLLSTFNSKYDPDNDSFTFSVYELKVSEEVRYYAVQFVNEPLKALRTMGEREGFANVGRKQCEDEVKLFCRSMSEIIRAESMSPLQNKCILVPFKEERWERLDNGGLVRLVLNAIERATKQLESISRNQGFWKLSDREESIISTHRSG